MRFPFVRFVRKGLALAAFSAFSILAAPSAFAQAHKTLSGGRLVPCPRELPGRPCPATQWKIEWRRPEETGSAWEFVKSGSRSEAVSYTHLTLPTICSV